MRTNNRRFQLALAGTFVSLLLASPGASAHGDDDREHPVREKQATAGEEPGADVDEETRFAVGIDFVAGFGKTVAADQIPPGSANINPVNHLSADPVTTDSFVASFGYELTKHIGFGFRIPLVMGSINPDGYQARFISAFGNLELEGEYSVEVARDLQLVASLGLALPTAQGTEVPATNADLAKTTFDQTSYDRFVLDYAAAASRGFEENALFFANRFGIVPKIALEWHKGGWRLEPYVKVENMISTSSSNTDKYIGELVIGARAAYLVGKYFEPGVRLWTTIVLTPADQPVAVVEPELRFHYGIVTPYIGGILPFAGPLAKDPSQFAGLRLGGALAF